MMMMPFVRLLVIYALVGSAIFAFLKRDDIMERFSEPKAEIAAEMDSVSEVSAPEPIAPDAAPTPAAATPATNPSFGSEITPQYFGQNGAVQAAAPQPRQQPDAELNHRWQQARQAFGQGDFAEAARLYEALAFDFPQNMDLRGETGNYYYNLGQLNEAATHYFAVAEIASKNGNTNVVNSMLNLLQRISPRKASELQSVLAANR